MGGLFLIIPILAFDIWLLATTAKRQVRRWLELRQPKQIAAALAIGLALAVWLTFFLRYSMGPKIRIQGFPIPLAFFHAEDKAWTSGPLPYAGATADFLTGLAIPFIPYKIAEFLKQVKAELK